jgi:adenylate cyclase
MAVAGVPYPQDDHRERLGIFALQILDIVKTVSRQHNVNLQVRIGLASGPLMAGLIGRNKFAYDVWGDTVNLASRMESQGKIDQIQVNADFMRHMYKVFHFQEAGTQNIRGVGSQATWFLLGKIDAMAGSESSRSG